MRESEFRETTPEPFQTSSDQPMQGSTQEHHQEGCSQDAQGGEEPEGEFQTGSPGANEEKQPSTSGSLPEHCPKPNPSIL